MSLGSAVIGALVIVFQDALVTLLKKWAQASSALLGRRSADRVFERNYCKWIYDKCQRTTLTEQRGAEPGREIALSDVYVIPTFCKCKGWPRLEMQEDTFGLPEGLEEGTHTLSLDEVLEHRTAVILGEPGSGKSTMLRFLALVHADQSANPTYLKRLGLVRPKRRIPILVPLREFASSTSSTSSTYLPLEPVV